MYSVLQRLITHPLTLITWQTLEYGLQEASHTPQVIGLAHTTPILEFTKLIFINVYYYGCCYFWGWALTQ